MANIKPITNIEVITDETQITGSENVLVEKDGFAKLIPMSLVKPASSGGYVIDTTAEDWATLQTDASYGDQILELVRNGVPLSIYLGASTDGATVAMYSSVIYVQVVTDATSGEVKIYLRGYSPTTSNINILATLVCSE